VPLLVRDIPTFVLWLDTITDKGDLLLHAETQAEKLMVDSEQCVALGDDLEELLVALREMAVVRSTPLSDFSFRRIRPLQRLIAAAFDDERRTGLLNRLTSVRIAGVSPVAGRWLTLWLAERLGWKTDAGGLVDRRGRPVAVEYTPHAEECDAEVRLSADAETVDVRTHGAGCADVDLPEGGARHPVLNVPEAGELLLEEVDNVNSDALLRSTLAYLMHIA
jgi:glucose-6-phosphate dehydrogenase assembly protein OpcA